MNEKTNWTLGPWYVAEATAYPSVKSSAVQGKRRGDKGIVTMYRSDAEHSANAHLIAAAPELYDALKVVHDNLYALLNDPEIGPEARKLYDFEDVAAMARPLAKARGES